MKNQRRFYITIAMVCVAIYGRIGLAAEASCKCRMTGVSEAPPATPMPADAQDCGTEWKSANLTTYTSYPDPGSEECIAYNGCTWAGQFAGLDGVQSEEWVRSNNIAAVHSKDFDAMNGKTLRIRQDGKVIDATVYDMCSDDDCGGCCTQNLGGDGYLIDLEKYTAERFGSSAGIVEFQLCP